MKSTSLRAVSLPVIAALTLVLAGCGSSSDGDGTASYGNVDMGAAIPSEQAAADMGAVTEQALSAEAGSPAVNASIIVSGDATVITGNPRDAAAKFTEQVLEVGGRIDWSSTSEYDSQPYASVTARIPADKFDAVLAGLDQFGTVQNSTTFNEDVTQQVTDLDARIKVLEDSITRLQDLMDQATSVDELIAAENGLTQRQAELDSLTAQLEWLDSQVSMSTLNVSFSTDVDSTGFSLGKAWQIFLKSLEVVGYGLLVALPWLVVAAIIFLLVRWGLAKRWAKLAAGTTNVDEVDAANTDPETLDVEVVEAEDAP